MDIHFSWYYGLAMCDTIREICEIRKFKIIVLRANKRKIIDLNFIFLRFITLYYATNFKIDLDEDVTGSIQETNIFKNIFLQRKESLREHCKIYDLYEIRCDSIFKLRC